MPPKNASENGAGDDQKWPDISAEIQAALSMHARMLQRQYLFEQFAGKYASEKENCKELVVVAIQEGPEETICQL